MTVPELAEPNTGNGTNESRPVPVLANCAFGYRTKNGKFPEVESKKGQYWKWVPVLEMGMPVPILANCAFGYLQIHIEETKRSVEG